ncbi:unnamed protein product [Paramecium sonneborni]|uniref:Uncharacterized protein n=1 Tax=Paramecium sonneborni TaxID=65129 RepID=A0A8S1QZM1_9CILI|nr:unnamed protein product [Paramecium sonneborni]CAD8121008.1 unnamed protein product [Paramecium sonneborni]
MSSQSQQEQDQDQENNEELQADDQDLSSKQQKGQKQVKSSIKKVRNYQKVPENLKSQLLKLVIQQGVKINQAAQQLNLKYATAKTIVFTYRAQSKPKKSKNKKKKTAIKVEFVPIQNNNVNPIHVEITIGGNIQNKFTLQ